MKKVLMILCANLFFACNEQLSEKKLSEPKSDTIQNQEDSVASEVTWEEEEGRLKKEYSNQLRDFKISMKKKEFNFTCYDKCDDGDGVGYEEIKKYGIGNPFDVKRQIKDDTLTIKFKFISSCCLEYIGDVEKRNDSLLLTYKNISYTPCDCRCYYYYMYSLPIENYQSKYVMLNNILIK